MKYCIAAIITALASLVNAKSNEPIQAVGFTQAELARVLLDIRTSRPEWNVTEINKEFIAPGGHEIIIRYDLSENRDEMASWFIFTVSQISIPLYSDYDKNLFAEEIKPTRVSYTINPWSGEGRADPWSKGSRMWLDGNISLDTLRAIYSRFERRESIEIEGYSLPLRVVGTHVRSIIQTTPGFFILYLKQPFSNTQIFVREADAYEKIKTKYTDPTTLPTP